MSYRREVALALLVAGVISVAVWAANRAPPGVEIDVRASTRLSGPSGSKALYDVLVRLGRPVERRRKPLFGLAEEDTARRARPALLMVLDPPFPLETAELAQVVRLVQRGGAVLAAGAGGGITRCAGWDLRPRDRFALESIPVRPPPSATQLHLPPVTRVLRWDPGSRLSGLVKRRLAAADDECASLARRGTDTLLVAAGGRPVIVRQRYAGGGTLTLAADVAWFRNQVWRDTDVPYVVLPLIVEASRGRRGRVVWDEYHQGFGFEAPTIGAVAWDWMLQSPAGWALLQLLAVGLVWLAVTAVRFGPARSVVERRRRSPLEHLEALAAGLEGAAGADTAVQRIVSGLRRRLSRSGHPTPDTRHVSPWLASLELAMPSARGRAVVRRLQRIVTERGGAERALAAAQAVEDVWEELRPRTTRDAF